MSSLSAAGTPEPKRRPERRSAARARHWSRRSGAHRRDELQPQYRRPRQGSPRPGSRCARRHHGPRRRRIRHPSPHAQRESRARPCAARASRPTARSIETPVQSLLEEPRALTRHRRGGGGARTSPAAPWPASASGTERSCPRAAVVLTTGTFLGGPLSWPASGWSLAAASASTPRLNPVRAACAPSTCPWGASRPGTPPRLDGRTLDWARLEAQPSR